MVKNYRVDFEAIKARADFRAVLAHYGLALLGQGEQAKVRCPFHDDERPSCSVNLEKGLFHCHAGGCGASGNVLEFVHRMEARDGATVSLREAAVTLAKLCGIDLGGEDGQKRRQEGRGEPSPKAAASVPSRAGNGAERGSGRRETAAADAAVPTCNKPLGFRLTLDPAHPYLATRGITPELVE